VTTRLVSIDNCQLTLGGVTGTPTTTNASGTALTTSLATYTFGSQTDTWGLAPSVLSNLSNVNSSAEGTGVTFSVWFIGEGGTSAAQVDVDAVQLTLWYGPASGGGTNNVPNGVAVLWLGTCA
jgi:hypothetical protein